MGVVSRGQLAGTGHLPQGSLGAGTLPHSLCLLRGGRWEEVSAGSPAVSTMDRAATASLGGCSLLGRPGVRVLCSHGSAISCGPGKQWAARAGEERGLGLQFWARGSPSSQRVEGARDSSCSGSDPGLTAGRTFCCMGEEVGRGGGHCTLPRVGQLRAVSWLPGQAQARGTRHPRPSPLGPVLLLLSGGVRVAREGMSPRGTRRPASFTSSVHLQLPDGVPMAELVLRWLQAVGAAQPRVHPVPP